MQDERRKEKRIVMYNSARVVCWGSETFGFFHNISAEGLGLFCEREYKPGDNVKIHLGLPDVVTLSGRMMWREESLDKEKGRYMYGIQLENRPPGYEKQIKDLLVEEN